MKRNDWRCITLERTSNPIHAVLASDQLLAVHASTTSTNRDKMDLWIYRNLDIIGHMREAVLGKEQQRR